MQCRLQIQFCEQMKEEGERKIIIRKERAEEIQNERKKTV